MVTGEKYKIGPVCDNTKDVAEISLHLLGSGLPRMRYTPPQRIGRETWGVMHVKPRLANWTFSGGWELLTLHNHEDELHSTSVRCLQNKERRLARVSYVVPFCLGTFAYHMGKKVCTLSSKEGMYDLSCDWLDTDLTQHAVVPQMYYITGVSRRTYLQHIIFFIYWTRYDPQMFWIYSSMFR